MSEAVASWKVNRPTGQSHTDYINACIQKRINGIARAIEHRFRKRIIALETELTQYKNEKRCEEREHQIREREERERETREREEREREERERETREREEREREERERETREREERERDIREREKRDLEIRERQEREREREDRERETRELEARERETREREIRDREIQELETREHQTRERLRKTRKSEKLELQYRKRENRVPEYRVKDPLDPVISNSIELSNYDKKLSQFFKIPESIFLENNSPSYPATVNNRPSPEIIYQNDVCSVYRTATPFPDLNEIFKSVPECSGRNTRNSRNRPYKKKQNH